MIGKRLDEIKIKGGKQMGDDLINRNRNINRGFRKLEVWREAVDFYVFMNNKLQELSNLSFKVKSQIEASAFSIHSNIAEGYGRRYLRETIQFNNIALGSLAENYSQIYALLKVKITDPQWFDQYDRKHYSLENKLIAYNRSQVKQLMNHTDWHDDYLLRDRPET